MDHKTYPSYANVPVIAVLRMGNDLEDRLNSGNFIVM